jgi:hypothetical protein
MTADRIRDTVDHMIKMMLVTLDSEGYATLSEEDIEKVESILVDSLTRNGLLDDR